MVYPLSRTNERVVREKPRLSKRQRDDVVVPEVIIPEGVNRDESEILRAQRQFPPTRIYPLVRRTNWMVKVRFRDTSYPFRCSLNFYDFSIRTWNATLQISVWR